MPIIIKYASIVIPEPLSPARRKIGDGRPASCHRRGRERPPPQEAAVPFKFPVKKHQFPENKFPFYVNSEKSKFMHKSEINKN